MTFGGCNPADDSGELSYAIIEFAGFIVASNREVNCLTLAAVGSATDVHHVQCHGGLDDGVEFFGGSVSVHHMVITAANDDAFDLSFGQNGQHQFVIIQEDAGDAAGDTKGLEVDGNEPAPGTNDTPRTQAKMFNFTVIGNLTQLTTLQNSALQFRRGAGVSLYNSVIAGWVNGLDLDDPLTCDPFDTGIGTIGGPDADRGHEFRPHRRQRSGLRRPRDRDGVSRGQHGLSEHHGRPRHADQHVLRGCVQHEPARLAHEDGPHGQPAAGEHGAQGKHPRRCCAHCGDELSRCCAGGSWWDHPVVLRLDPSVAQPHHAVMYDGP